MIYKIASLLEVFKLISSYLVIVLALAFVFLFKHFPKIKVLSWLLKIFSGLLILMALVLSFLNGYLWKRDAVSYRLLPPYAPLTYVLHYSWQHYFFAPIVTIFFALIVFWGIKSLNKKFNNTFFYDEEPYLAALGILATGWPNCLIFLSLVLFLGIFVHFLFLCFNFNKRRRREDIAEKTVAQAERAWSLSFREKRGGSEDDLPAAARRAKAGRVEENISRAPFRLSLLYFWLPCALLVLLLGGIISKYIGITQLSI